MGSLSCMHGLPIYIFMHNDEYILNMLYHQLLFLIATKRKKHFVNHHKRITG